MKGRAVESADGLPVGIAEGEGVGIAVGLTVVPVGLDDGLTVRPSVGAAVVGGKAGSAVGVLMVWMLHCPHVAAQRSLICRS